MADEVSAMNGRLPWISIFCGLALFSCLGQAEQRIVCPDNVMQKGGSVSEEDIPSSFETMAQTSRAWLSGVSLYDGHPERNAVLKPHEDTPHSATWRFDEWSFPNGKWISCDYGAYGAILYKRLDDDVAECTATLEGTWKERNRKIRTVCH